MHVRPSAPTRLASIAARFVAVLVALLLVGGAPATAHTDLDFTLPTDGAAVGEPVREITVGFTEAVTLVGPGFEVLDPQGRTLTPFAVTDDDRVFRLQLDPPIGGGEAAVRYEVRAEDGHVITGGFRFTISAAEPTTTLAPPTTLAPTSAPPASTAPATVGAAQSTTTTTTTTTSGSTPSSATDGPADPAGEGGSGTGVYVAVILVVVAAALGTLVVRARGLRSG